MDKVFLLLYEINKKDEKESGRIWDEQKVVSISNGKNAFYYHR